jgi:putative phosphonate metabolism protein
MLAMTPPEAGPRYAIYYVPERTSALYRFGTAVLGYDCYSGNELPNWCSLPAWNEAVREPRRYGFHATLKAPFHLATSAREVDLFRDFTSFAREQAVFTLTSISVRELDGFIAVVPDEPAPVLNHLAQNCVRYFDRFRAPLTEQDRRRRLKSPLTERQIQNLDRWGYPYVFDDFRFHMTLTGRLETGEREDALSRLCHEFQQASPVKHLTIGKIVIARQHDGASPFKVVRAAPLGVSMYRPFAELF